MSELSIHERKCEQCGKFFVHRRPLKSRGRFDAIRSYSCASCREKLPQFDNGANQRLTSYGMSWMDIGLTTIHRTKAGVNHHNHRKAVMVKAMKRKHA